MRIVVNEQKDMWRGHQPVLADSVLHVLDPKPGKVLFDGTIGGGGHAKLLLEKGVFLIGCDLDADALAHAKQFLTEYSDNLQLIHLGYDEVSLNPSSLDGIIIDLGVSSHQLESPHRGFSFLSDGPLDMRMDTTRGRTAENILSESSDEELFNLLLDIESSPQMKLLAHALIKERKKTHFKTTRQLASWVEKFWGTRWRRSHHPATLLFLALRVAVNQELQRLHSFLTTAPQALKPGGVLAVITFHSSEDQLVKKSFHTFTQPWLDTDLWPNSIPNPNYICELVTKKPLVPSQEEIAQNPRARSAKLRAIRRIDKTRTI